MNQLSTERGTGVARALIAGMWHPQHGPYDRRLRARYPQPSLGLGPRLP